MTSSSKKTSITAPCNTKIVCTIGPASSSTERLEEMILAGMDICRLNFSHGEHAVHKEIFDRIRTLSADYNNQVAILCDIQGPKIRTGKMVEAFEIGVGDTIRVTPDNIMGTKERISISYENMLHDLGPNDVIFINDGIVKLVVNEVDTANHDLICKCHAAGRISDHKGCNMPSGKLSVNVVTPKDAKDLKFIAQELDPEYVAASFVGTGDDVRKVRQCLADHGNTDIKIIAKIERPVALENLDDIIEEADAVMVARGDLGVEIEAWDVPKWQKEMVKRCNRESKPVIVATQMLESMCENSRPTRAEASDVYNAVIDGADAVMLSGESSVGKWPVIAVSCMNEIVRVAQGNMPIRHLRDYDSKSQAITETVCHAACTIGRELKELSRLTSSLSLSSSSPGKYIVVTAKGRGARLLSKYRPSMPILVFSESIRVVRELALVWGIRAHHLQEIESLPLEERAMKAIEVARAIGYLEPTDKKVCVVSASQYSGTGFFTGVYDVDALELARKAKRAQTTGKGTRGSMI